MTTNPVNEGVANESTASTSEANSVDAGAETIFGLLDREDSTTPEGATEEEENNSNEEEETNDTETSSEEDNEDTNPEEETSEEESNSEGDVYTIKLDGEEIEVSEDELLNGYQRQADYTRKTQALAEEFKSISSEREALQTERQQYVEALEYLKSNMSTEVDKFEGVNWAALKADDPDEYTRQRVEYQEAKENVQKVEVEQQRAITEATKAAQEALKVQMQEEAGKIAKLIPELNDPEKAPTIRTDLKSYALSQGLSETELNNLFDSRSINILYKAMQFDQSSKAGKKLADKKIKKKVPKFVKSGTPNAKSEIDATKKSKKKKKLKDSGDIHDAADIFFDMM